MYQNIWKLILNYLILNLIYFEVRFLTYGIKYLKLLDEKNIFVKNYIHDV